MTNTNNLELWEKLGKTDPAHTKAFQRSGGFKGTAIKPIYSYKRMTEEFGACGDGWGINEPTFTVVPAADEVLVFCTVSIWHGGKDKVVYGVGGDKVLVKQSSGIRSDDEAFKKAFTDAVTNALKLIGVGADVHMGLFDDQKYVNTLKEEFGEEHVSAPAETNSSEDPNLPKARTVVSKAVTALAPLDKYQQTQWFIDNPKANEALHWVKRNFPAELVELEGIGVTIE